MMNCNNCCCKHHFPSYEPLIDLPILRDVKWTEDDIVRVRPIKTRPKPCFIQVDKRKRTNEYVYIRDGNNTLNEAKLNELILD